LIIGLQRGEGLVYFFHATVFWTRAMGEKLFRGLGGRETFKFIFFIISEEGFLCMPVLPIL
jgi:hypothetical protein